MLRHGIAPGGAIYRVASPALVAPAVMPGRPVPGIVMGVSRR
jgi:hypothetical protein